MKICILYLGISPITNPHFARFRTAEQFVHQIRTQED
jgi:hypothetical protein